MNSVLLMQYLAAQQQPAAPAAPDVSARSGHAVVLAFAVAVVADSAVSTSGAV
jgi:hypothetical protein